MTTLENQFDAAMINIYHRAQSEAGYTATRYLRMLHEHGGLGTAQMLLYAKNVSEGYAALWERGRLDLTVESLILDKRWNEFFTDDDRAIARKRLEQYGFDVPSL